MAGEIRWEEWGNRCVETRHISLNSVKLYLLLLLICQLISFKINFLEFDFRKKFVKLAFSAFFGYQTATEIVPGIFGIVVNQIIEIIQSNRWTIANILWSTNLLVECRGIVQKMPISVETFDEKVRDLIFLWTKSFTPRLFPRPYHEKQLIDFAEVHIVMDEWTQVSFIVSGVFPSTDHVCKENWLRIGALFTSQLNNNFLTNVTTLLESNFLLNHDELFLERFSNLSHIFGVRSILRSYCTRVTISSAAPCSLLEAKDNKHMSNFMKFLDNGSSLVCTYAGPGIVEFCTRTLLDPERRKRFLNFSCDRQHEFSDDYVISCFTGLKRRPTIRFGRMFPLDYPVNSIVLSSRNSLAKKRFKVELIEMHGLKLVDESVSPMPCLNSPQVNSHEMHYACQSFIHIWWFSILELEGCLKLSPKVTCNLLNFYISTIYYLLTSPKPIARYLSRFLWKGACKMLFAWLKYMEQFYWEGRITLFGVKSLSLIRFVHKAIVLCPFSDAFDRNKLDDLLERISYCVIDGFNYPDFHLESALQAILLCIDGCRRLLNPNKHWPERPSSGIIMSRLVGTGTFGSVFKIYDYEHNNIIALKEIDLKGESVMMSDVMEEVNYLRCLTHQNIVQFHGASIVGSKLYIKTEFCAGGSLLDLASQTYDWTPNGINLLFKRIVISVLLGLCFLHGNDIIHGDLKPANILMDIFGWAKLADFGATRTLLRAANSNQPSNFYSLGTAEYMAPETLLEGKVTVKSDIWSLGCTLYHLVTGKVPWEEEIKPWGILQSLKKGELFNLSRLHLSHLDQKIKDFILSCLQFDIESRPSALDLMISPFLYELSNDLLLQVNHSW